MSSTYKPALLKALTRLVQSSDDLRIPLVTIGDEFAHMYWNQTVIYHLRQAAALTKEAEVIKAIREVARTTASRRFVELPVGIRLRLAERMAKILTINVLSAFHASKPDTMEPLYLWALGDDAIVLTTAAQNFLRIECAPLELMANYFWAKFLESCNRLAPHIISKVERMGLDRGNLRKYLSILLEAGDSRCFYCDGILGDGGRHIDHVIPWSFLLEDPLWDLVIACPRCNIRKSDWLPERKFIDLLVVRNIEHYSLLGICSFDSFSTDVMRCYEAAVSVEWPGFWSPETPNRT